MMYGHQLVSILATDGGTTAAIAIAVITLLGTLSANIVTWTKTKNDAHNSRLQLDADRKKSNVEVAQNVLSETITMLNDRLRSENETNSMKLETLRASHQVEIDAIRAQHKRDMSRLEKKIERLTEQYEQCQLQNSNLLEQLAEFNREE